MVMVKLNLDFVSGSCPAEFSKDPVTSATGLVAQFNEKFFLSYSPGNVLQKDEIIIWVNKEKFLQKLLHVMGALDQDGHPELSLILEDFMVIVIDFQHNNILETLSLAGEVIFKVEDYERKLKKVKEEE